ncbi:Na(+)/H(+) antiporter subunit B [Sinomonas atrocyanea]
MSDSFLTDLLLAVSLTLVLAGAVVVVLTRRPSRQAVALSAYGLVLALMFMVLQAPDVALSQVAIGTAVVPLIVVLAIRKVESVRSEQAESRRGQEEQ